MSKSGPVWLFYLVPKVTQRIVERRNRVREFQTVVDVGPGGEGVVGPPRTKEEDVHFDKGLGATRGKESDEGPRPFV